MIVQFSVKNFKTFKDLTTFSLVANNYDKAQERENVIPLKSNYNLLKSAVLYGANASGKTKFFEAIARFLTFIEKSSGDSFSKTDIPVVPFLLDNRTSKKPSTFELVFLLDNIQYRYGFEANKKQVFSEWLYKKGKIREVQLFNRDKQSITYSKIFSGAKNIVQNNMIRSNALFLSVLAQFNDKTSCDIQNQFDKYRVISATQEKSYEGFTAECIENKSMKASIVRFLKTADLGIEDLKLNNIEFDDLPEEFLAKVKEIEKAKEKLVVYSHISTFRKKFNNKVPLREFEEFSMDKDESAGTNKYFKLSGPILDTLKNGYTLFIDELDSQLHPLLVKHLISLFNSSKYNKKNAQLIFNTHDINLLSSGILRRDQIWFTEKDRYGSSHLYSLLDIKTDDNKKIRNDENYEKNYIQGKYGAIPYIDQTELEK